MANNWNVANPLDHTKVGDLPAKVRNAKEIAVSGMHRFFYQSAAPTARFDATAFDADDLGSMWIDSDDNKIYKLTASTPTWTLISADIIGEAVASPNTWLSAQTHSVSPVFTAGIVGNNAYLQGRGSGDSSNIDLIKVNASDIPTVPDGIANVTSAAPASAATLANKQYVDAQDSADHPAYTGGESHTDGSGLIIKMGKSGEIAANGTLTITFATAFPGGIVTAICTLIATTATAQSANINATATKTALVIRNTADAAQYAYWIAIGY